MDTAEVKSLIEQGIPGCEVYVEGSGDKYQLIVVSETFAGLSPVKKQQQVYACLQQQIQDGTIHAVTMKTLTPEEWKKERVFLGL